MTSDRRLLSFVSVVIAALGTSAAAADGAVLMAKGIIRNDTSIEDATIIPAILGTRFGIVFRMKAVAGKIAPNVTVTWRFPAGGLDNPETGRTSHVDSHKINCGAKWICATLWKFDEPWELVPGVWEVEIVINKRTALRQSFTVVSP